MRNRGQKQGFQWGGDLLKMAMFMVLLCLERNVTRIGIGSACGVSFRFGFGFTVGTLARELSVDSRLSPGLRRRLSTVISMQGGGKRGDFPASVLSSYDGDIRLMH
jgi:hypothetical protein